MFEKTIVGNQPKISDVPGRVNLRLARNRFDSGKIDANALDEACHAAIRDTIQDQETAGLDRVTDGRICWDDPVTPFATAHDGFQVGGLIRFFDNNVYYRRPVISGPVRFVRSAVAHDFRLTRSFTDKPLLASVCGPFSLAKFCVDDNYNKRSNLYSECAHLVRCEIDALIKAGADWVQLDEPFLGFCPEETGPAIDAIRAAVRGLKIKTLVYIYFAPVSAVIERLWDLPVTMIGADCVTVPANLDALCDGPPSMGRTFGLLDARNTRLEPVDQITSLMDRIVSVGGETWPDCWLAPSAGLEFLPYRNAMAKMQRLTEAVSQFTGVPVANG